MKFLCDEKWYEADVCKTFENAEPDDYEFDLYDNGVKLADFPDCDDFSDCEGVYLYYDPCEERATIQLARDDYTTLKDVDISEDEWKLIREYLS